MAARGVHRKHLYRTPKHRREPFDYIVYFFMVATPLFELPQLLAIYRNHNAQNVSLTTWLFFCVDNVVWMVYGIKRKQWPVFFTAALYTVMEVGIVVGILLYS